MLNKGFGRQTQILFQRNYVAFVMNNYANLPSREELRTSKFSKGVIQLKTAVID